MIWCFSMQSHKMKIYITLQDYDVLRCLKMTLNLGVKKNIKCSITELYTSCSKLTFITKTEWWNLLFILHALNSSWYSSPCSDRSFPSKHKVQVQSNQIASVCTKIKIFINLIFDKSCDLRFDLCVWNKPLINNWRVRIHTPVNFLFSHDFVYDFDNISI